MRSLVVALAGLAIAAGALAYVRVLLGPESPAAVGLSAAPGSRSVRVVPVPVFPAPPRPNPVALVAQSHKPAATAAAAASERPKPASRPAPTPAGPVADEKVAQSRKVARGPARPPGPKAVAAAGPPPAAAEPTPQPAAGPAAGSLVVREVASTQRAAAAPSAPNRQVAQSHKPEKTAEEATKKADKASDKAKTASDKAGKASTAAAERPAGKGAVRLLAGAGSQAAQSHKVQPARRSDASRGRAPAPSHASPDPPATQQPPPAEPNPAPPAEPGEPAQPDPDGAHGKGARGSGEATRKAGKR